MINIGSIIASHNKFILRPKTRKYSCTSTNKESDPLKNKFLAPTVIYEATLINNIDNETGIVWCFRHR